MEHGVDVLWCCPLINLPAAPPSLQVLAEELDHTSATLAAMEASHASLAKTRSEYQGQHGRLKRSKGLLGTLNWQAKSVRLG